MSEIDFKHIGERLKEIRLSKNLTQEYVANLSEVNTSHISNIENNRVKISLSTLIRVCNAMNTTVDYVLHDEYDDISSTLDLIVLNELRDCDNATKERALKIIQILK
ncbi:MAG: helix-turn-helix transcriptional regulator [Lachnospiraceae bacterium]|nr:helix-turn-helix transcriptional regulator [Lachnospiraceae bacterium]